jgi:hypothetical protein
MIKQFIKLSAVATFAFAFVVAPVASAATTTTVTPTSLNGWYIEADSWPTESDPGTVKFVADSTSMGDGALELVTPNNNDAYAQITKDVSIPIDEVTEASYMTKTLAGPAFASAAFAFGLDTDANGDVEKYYSYEPYSQITDYTELTSWQTWDVLSGKMWTGGTGQALVTWDAVKSANPGAVVKSITVYQGTYNPGYTVNVDAVTLNGTMYDFEQAQQKQVATNKDDCKSNGWKNLVSANSKDFKNQGQCVASVVSSDKSKHNRETVTLNQTF